MKRYSVSFLLFFIVCHACTTEQNIDYFEVTKEIVDYDRIYSDGNDLLGTISEMEILDSILIVRLADNEYGFGFIDLDKGCLVRKWARTGRGPGEYVQLGPIFDISDLQLVVMDKANREIDYVDISDILRGENLPQTIKEPYPVTASFRPRGMNIIGDEKIAVGSFEKGRFGILDAKNNILDCPYDYPFDCDERVKGIYLGTTYQAILKSNDRCRRFVIMTMASDIFEIYETAPSGINRIYVSDFKQVPPVKEVPGRGFAIDSEKSIEGLCNVAVSDELICFAYSPRNFMKFIGTEYNTNEILCFNWKGEKVKKYILPISVSEFCIDKNYIYGLKTDANESVIYRFKMN